ncbi:MAG: hypothetical protein U5N85_17495 [Arcicella sp.]|nr:hypothetical protein [Arcicella sp.]
MPKFKKNFFSSGFILVKINLKTKTIFELTKAKVPLLYLEKIENNNIFYFKNLDENKKWDNKD